MRSGGGGVVAGVSGWAVTRRHSPSTHHVRASAETNFPTGGGGVGDVRDVCRFVPVVLQGLREVAQHSGPRSECSTPILERIEVRAVGPYGLRGHGCESVEPARQLVGGAVALCGRAQSEPARCEALVELLVVLGTEHPASVHDVVVVPVGEADEGLIGAARRQRVVVHEADAVAGLARGCPLGTEVLVDTVPVERIGRQKEQHALIMPEDLTGTRREPRP